MSNNYLEMALALECLRAPLNPNPITAHERFIHEHQIKYRSYNVEYNNHDGTVKLPQMFTSDFGQEIGRIAILADLEGNQFEVLVDKVNGNIYLTRGWAALRDFYNIRAGAWLQLVYTGNGHFGLLLKDRFHEDINPPTFIPPVRLVIDKSDVPPYFVDDLPDSPELLAYSHEPHYFHLHCDKYLSHSDVTSGFLVVPYEDFGENIFHETTSSIKLVDDSGNAWTCSLMFSSIPSKHYKIGGDWKVLVATRRLTIGDSVRLGVQGTGFGDVIYFELDP